MPLVFTDPAWLLLIAPALLVVLIGWLAAARLLPRARRAASLVIRIVLVVALGMVLAGARLALPSDRLAVVFLVDGSASMVPGTRDALVDFARDSVAKMPQGDLAGVVVFGSNALVDRLPSDVNELQTPASVPVVASTDIAAAVRLAAAIMPAGTQQRLVLLSDGNDTGGDATDAISAAAVRGIHLDVVLPSTSSVSFSLGKRPTMSRLSMATVSSSGYSGFLQ